MYYIYLQPGALNSGNDQSLCLFRVSGHTFHWKQKCFVRVENGTVCHFQLLSNIFVP